jgi:hypothetical protein
MSDPSSDSSPFPPEEIGAFLRCCAGEWMGLRSQFALGEVSAGDADDDGWHTSVRGELRVAFLEPDTPDGPGGLQVGPKDGVAQQLQFSADGAFRNGAQQGRWQLWPDGSLELVITTGGREVRERIWFTKPNLRLRSTVVTRADGLPDQASFSSEIRRVSRPAN